MDHLYKWQRKTTNFLNNNDLPGPDADFHGEKNTYFLYAGDKLAGKVKLFKLESFHVRK